MQTDGVISWQGNETYRHIEEEEMKKVEEAVNTKRAWMNTKQHACSLSPKTSDPTVRSVEIRAEKSVSTPLYYKSLIACCVCVCVRILKPAVSR